MRYIFKERLVVWAALCYDAPNRAPLLQLVFTVLIVLTHSLSIPTPRLSPGTGSVLAYPCVKVRKSIWNANFARV